MKRVHLLVFWCVAAFLVTASAKAPESFSGSFAREAVAADQPLASQAGAEILAAGGNAADAAAATMLALGVVNPASSGLGGGGFALYYRAEDRSVTFLDFRERAPAKATRTMFEDAERLHEGPASAPSQLGGLAAGVPGEPAGVAALVDRFGKLPLKRVVAPSLRLAEQGFPVSESTARMARYFQSQLDEDPIMKTWDLRPGATLRRPALARVLRALGSQGDKAIYRGAIAKEIVRSVRTHGGIMTMQDLADYRVVSRKPLEGNYFGFLWVTAPPPSAGGYTLLQSLAILELAIGKTPTYGADFLNALAESWKGPYLDRQRYFGDPDQVILPLEAMMNPQRIERRAGLVRQNKDNPSEAYDFPIEATDRSLRTPDNPGTSHLCVVDREGNVASVTTTINLPFGARFTAGGLVMNDEMDDFASGVGVVNAFGLVGGARNLPGPRKRPVSTMTPTIVFKDGKPVLCVGASGGSRIVTATEQVALNVLLFGKNAAEAVAAPRIHHQAVPNTLRMEKFAPLPENLEDALEERGYTIEPINHVATVQVIEIENQGQQSLMAASDPRKGGSPAGQ